MANLVFAQKIRYTDNDKLAIHSEPNTSKTNVVGWITPGEVCTTDALVNMADGQTMMHEPRGWFSTGGPDRYWFEPVEAAPTDTSAMEAQIASLGALVDARDARIVQQDAANASQSQLLADNIAEVTRLRDIILDGPKRMDP